MTPETAGRVVRGLWVTLGVVVLALYSIGPGERAFVLVSDGISTRNGFFALMHLVLEPVAIVTLCGLGFVLTAYQPPPAATSSSGEPALRFPQTPTGIVGLWLVVATLGFLFFLFEALRSCDPGNLTCVRDSQLAVAALAGGAGSMVATILGYLKHASDRRDFRLSYTPWYFARPLMGVLLAVVFYFLLKGGLLVLGETPTNAEMNIYGLAGLSSLVGMFSKNAVEKLRDVFGTLFATQADVRERLADALSNNKDFKALPPDAQQAVSQVLKELI